MINIILATSILFSSLRAIQKLAETKSGNSHIVLTSLVALPILTAIVKEPIRSYVRGKVVECNDRHSEWCKFEKMFLRLKTAIAVDIIKEDPKLDSVLKHQYCQKRINACNASCRHYDHMHKMIVDLSEQRLKMAEMYFVLDPMKVITYLTTQLKKIKFNNSKLTISDR